MPTRQKPELPPIPEAPEGFAVTASGPTCTIEHVRSGMGGLNLFLGVLLTGFSIACAFLTYAYLTGARTDKGSTIPLWLVLGFVISWLAVGFCLLYSRCARKTFVLEEDALRIETRLLGLRWELLLPRDTVSRVRQVQDGGQGDDSFPSWGLKVKSAAAADTLLDRLPLVNRWVRSHQFRSVLYRLPYEQSAWLGIVIGRWAGVEPELCPKPETLQQRSRRRRR